MKKSLILGAVCALFMANSAMAQTADGVTYVEDPAQGYLFNDFKDNWFITAEGGATFEVNKIGNKRKWSDRFAPAAGLYVGKWFSPLLGVRFGVSAMQVKSLSGNPDFGRLDEPTYAGLYKTKFNELGPAFDVMLSLTNWWCGYHPGRKYNAVVYAGTGGYWFFNRHYDKAGVSEGWKYSGERVLAARVGIINQFQLSPAFGLALDLRMTATDSYAREAGNYENQTAWVAQAYLQATYRFKKREWSAPVIPVCPPAQDCTQYIQQLEDANARIAELERQLDTCLKRPVGKTVVEKVETEAPLATIYFPINVSKLTAQDTNVLTAVSEVMKQNPNKKYTVCGWADNYTGNDVINTRLRNERANSAATFLKSCGVPASQLNVTINAGNLSNLGEKFVALDRAVTIEEAK